MEFDKAESSSTPKLSLYNTFPSKKREPPGMVTLPPQTLASIPFHWEEAPGKPRATAGAIGNSPVGPILLKSSKSSVRCLVPPPPRLMMNTNDSSSTKFTNLLAPTSVLGGPYADCSLPHEERLRRHRRRRSDGKERLNLITSWRWPWGSSNEISRSNDTEGTKDFSRPVGVGVGNESDLSKVNITTTRVIRRRRRSNSFLTLSTTASCLLSSIYESFKQAVPWKPRPDK